MWKYSNITFDWKHIDEKVLYFARPSKKQTVFELLKVVLPVLLVETVFIILWSNQILSGWLATFIIVSIFILTIITVAYKIYRSKRNYFYITSKRIFFHWIEWIFNDYMKKVSYENVINVNYFTNSLLWRIFKYGTLEVQTAHSWLWDIHIYNIEYGKMLALYIDKLMSLSQEERNDFYEFDPNYFKNSK